MDGMGSKLKTQPIRVIIYTDDLEIKGFIHIKPGGYQSRVSDMMNLHDLQYLPITQATIYFQTQPPKEPKQVHAVILRLDTIKMVIPLDEDLPPLEGPEPAPDTAGGPAGDPSGASGSPWGGGPWGR